MTIMVTGGAGYIGSHMVKHLRDAKADVFVVDDLSSGHRDAVGPTELVEADIRDTDTMATLLAEREVDLVMHFASKIEVGESVVKPELYYDSIVFGTLSLLRAMVAADVQALVFSSSAAVYGEPTTELLGESHRRSPTNPYGRAKNIVEDMLGDFHRAHGLSSISLRYFNAAGAAADGSLGERHDPETHLIPLLLHAASGRREKFKIFGSDYPTPDGTCVRDFVHIEDICGAHFLAAERLKTNQVCEAFNLGNGKGFSVQAVVDTVREVTGKEFTVEAADRRPGDPGILVADSTAAQEVLKWLPRYRELHEIITHAWAWETRGD